MKIAILLLPLVLAVAVISSPAAQGPLLTIVAPSQEFSSGAAWHVDLVAFNPSSVSQSMQPPLTLLATANMAGLLYPVIFHPDETQRMMLPAGGFGVRRYTAKMTPSGSGLVALEFASGLPEVLRTAIAVRAGSDAPASDTPESPTLNQLLAQNTAESTIERSFVNRFGFHEPVYFIYGPDDPAAKFQFSFKYQLATLQAGDDERFTHTVQGAFTQRSLWDIDSSSSPFYDTSYMPEIMLQSIAPMPKGDGSFTWLGSQLSFKHESNGRAGGDSRSLNTVVLRGAFVLGKLEDWHVVVAPEVFGYVTSLDDNPRLKDYRGHGSLWLMLEKNSRLPSLAYAVHAGRDFRNVTQQVDLTIPFRSRWLDVETAFLVQYFSGYGESLLDYTRRSETVRAGISLVR